jgi:hypothetical protein
LHARRSRPPLLAHGASSRASKRDGRLSCVCSLSDSRASPAAGKPAHTHTGRGARCRAICKRVASLCGENGKRARLSEGDDDFKKMNIINYVRTLTGELPEGFRSLTRRAPCPSGRGGSAPLAGAHRRASDCADRPAGRMDWGGPLHSALRRRSRISITRARIPTGRRHIEMAARPFISRHSSAPVWPRRAAGRPRYTELGHARAAVAAAARRQQQCRDGHDRSVAAAQRAPLVVCRRGT